MQTDEREVINLAIAKRELEKQNKEVLHGANVFLIVGLLLGAFPLQVHNKARILWNCDGHA